MSYLLAISVVIVLFLISLATGVNDLTLSGVFDGRTSATWLVLTEIRIPRTLALIFAGSGMAVSGTIMQMLARNRFVEPSTAGTVESASLGILTVLLLAPDLPVYLKMLVANAFALAGTSLFLLILTRIPLRSPLMVPLVGIMLGGIISAVTTFFAYRFDMMQSLNSWTTGDFSAVLRGRYELLWLSLGLTVIAFITADRFHRDRNGRGLCDQSRGQLCAGGNAWTRHRLYGDGKRGCQRWHGAVHRINCTQPRQHGDGRQASPLPPVDCHQRCLSRAGLRHHWAACHRAI